MPIKSKVLEMFAGGIHYINYGEFIAADNYERVPELLPHQK